jgi:hypothetical protein
MQWPWVSRRKLNEYAGRWLRATERESAAANESRRLWTLVVNAGAEISKLHGRISCLLGIAGAPAGLAEIFASLRDDQQAEFLNAAGAASKGWRETKPDQRRAITPHSDYQWIGVVENLDEEGQRVIDDLAEFLRLHREKATA